MEECGSCYAETNEEDLEFTPCDDRGTISICPECMENHIAECDEEACKEESEND